MKEASPKKSLGQHWLHDDAALDAMVKAADVKKADTVLEIGPGLGTLTKKLVAAAKQVVAVELDEKLAAALPKSINAPNLQVVQGNILEFDLTQLPPGYKVVANIPYYLTSHLIRQLCESPNHFSQAALLVQKEVAERVAAPAGETSVLSITTQFYCEVSLGHIIPAELFTPPPKVDSQILILKYRPKPLFPGVDRKEFFGLVKAGFSERRKKLRSSLSGGFRIAKSDADALLQEAGIDGSLRAQNLTLDQWHDLYKVIKN